MWIFGHQKLNFIDEDRSICFLFSDSKSVSSFEQSSLYDSNPVGLKMGWSNETWYDIFTTLQQSLIPLEQWGLVRPGNMQQVSVATARDTALHALAGTHWAPQCTLHCMHCQAHTSLGSTVHTALHALAGTHHQTCKMLGSWDPGSLFFHCTASAVIK